MSGNKCYLLLETSLWRLSHTIWPCSVRSPVSEEAGCWFVCMLRFLLSKYCIHLLHWMRATHSLSWSYWKREWKAKLVTKGVTWAKVSYLWPFSPSIWRKESEKMLSGGGGTNPFIDHSNFQVYKIDTDMVPFYTLNRGRQSLIYEYS